jgi:hypothetical protein
MAKELNQVDLAFVVDTTGSMSPFIHAARRHMVATLKALAGDALIEIDLQVGVVEYRDHPSQERSFVYRAHALTGNLGRAQAAVSLLRAQGGGDEPEAVYDGLVAACDQLRWRRHSRRIAILVGDAPPHGVHRDGDGFPDGCPLGLTLESTTASLEREGIVLHALGMRPTVRESFAALANHTGGGYYQAAQGADAIAEVKDVIAREFGDLAFDQKVYDLCARERNWTVDLLCESLETSRGRVSASLSRLGRRHLLD